MQKAPASEYVDLLDLNLTILTNMSWVNDSSKDSLKKNKKVILVFNILQNSISVRKAFNSFFHLMTSDWSFSRGIFSYITPLKSGISV